MCKFIPVTLFWRASFLLLILLTGFTTGKAQNVDKAKQKLEKYREENWPPVRSYGRNSLGYALQQTFKKHADYCGFGLSDNKRDFIPADIGKFLGKRNLRTKVETADIRGGGLLFYVFSGQDRSQAFDYTNFSPGKILHLNCVNNQFAINPDDNFDAFILTKNCSGYLKSSLDAGIEPPYIAFKTALQTDERRESSVLALSGAFLSPLKLILDANDSRTTEVLMQLWKFYADHPEYINNAYYLREFEGVMIKHISQAESNFKLESEVGININALLPARLKTDVGIGRGANNSFLGTDWQTIVYSDNEGPVVREKMFSPLPSPADIQAYFAKLKPVYEKSRDLPLMTEGMQHKHYLRVEGIPDFMSQQFWDIEQVNPGIYDGMPVLSTTPFRNEADGSFGCEFTVAGKPAASNFEGSLTNRPGKVRVSYVIRSRQPVGGSFIRFYINEEIQTSAHPIAVLTNGTFDLHKKEDRRFAFQWKFAIELDDEENPVDLRTLPLIDQLTVRRSDKTLNVMVSDIHPDAQRRLYWVTIETVDTYPLDLIDDHNMISYNLSMDVHLQSQRSGARSVRPIKGILSFPMVKTPAPPDVNVVSPENGQAPATPVDKGG